MSFQFDAHLLQSRQNLHFQDLLQLVRAALRVQFQHRSHLLSYAAHVVLRKDRDFSWLAALHHDVEVEKRTCIFVLSFVGLSFAHFSALVHAINCLFVIWNIVLFGLEHRQDVGSGFKIGFEGELVAPPLFIYLICRFIFFCLMVGLAHLIQFLIPVFLYVVGGPVAASVCDHRLVLQLALFPLPFFSLLLHHCVFSLLVEHQQVHVVYLPIFRNFKVELIFRNKPLTLFKHSVTILFC